jgi:hypothetical protein
MSLIQRLSHDHSIREFRAAARLRLREATHLATANHRLGAIYLSGYAGEMLLKAAYFRLAGWGLTVRITLADIQAAKVHATSALGLPWPGNLHDLTSWTSLLIEERRHSWPGLPGQFCS